MGRRGTAFYSAIVRGRPTWVSWTLLPAVLRLRGELRALDEVYDGGGLSENAYRIGCALEASGGVSSTTELRCAAGFPSGKEQRAAFLKAVEELDTRLLLAKVFSDDDQDMRHALVSAYYREHVAAAERLSYDEALDQILLAYLPSAVYSLPDLLARHLKLPASELRAGLARMAARQQASEFTVASVKGTCFAWQS